MDLESDNRRGDDHRYNSSFDFDKHHDRHHYYPYRSNSKRHLTDEFKKENPPNFDGDVKKSKEAEAWILGMKKFFELHEYTDNMKAKIAIFSLKGNENT